MNDLLDALRSGTAAFVIWRKRHPDEPIEVPGADLCGVELPRADLGRAILRNASLVRADLRETNLRWADLRGANLRNAILRDADLRGAKLGGAHFEGADLSGVLTDGPIPGVPSVRAGRFGMPRGSPLTESRNEIDHSGREDVRFSAFYKARHSSGETSALLVYLHGADASKEVERRARLGLGDERPSSSSAAECWPIALGRSVRLVPRADGVEFTPTVATVTWSGIIEEVTFGMLPFDRHRDVEVRGSVAIYLGMLNIARIPIELRFESGTESAERMTRLPSSAPFRRIFASYSHKDAVIVQEFERFVHAFGDRYTRDVSDLRSGEQWQVAICDLIDEADVFQLFWSHNSMTSPFVRKEWEYALGLGRPNFVRPTYWENPLPEVPEEGLPPEELRALQFHHLVLPAS